METLTDEPLEGKSLLHQITPPSEERSPVEPVPFKKWTGLLLLAGISTTIGAAIPVGYTIGVVNTPAVIIKGWCNSSLISRYDVKLDDGEMDILWSAIVSIFLIGGMVGSLSGSWLADKIGRKGAILLSGILALIAALFFVISKPVDSVELLFLGRILVGLSSGLVTGVVPMYLTELSPSSLRGAMGVLCPLGITFGVLLGQIMGLPFLLGNENGWNYLLALYAVPIIICASALPWLPESPKYMFAVKGDKENALRELSRLRNLPSEWVENELEDKKESESGVWSVMRLLSTPSLYLRLALVCALQAGQQTSGINAVFYYSVSIFENAGLSHTNAQYASLGAGVVNFVIAFLIIPVVNHFPRRALAITSCSLATLALILLTVTISFMNTIQWISYISIAAVLLFVLFYGMGLGPIPYFIGSELFDVGPRPAAMALGSVSNWSGNFIVGMTFPTLQRHIGQYSFLLFATSTVLLTVFLKCCLPESNPRIVSEKEAKRKANTPKS